VFGVRRSGCANRMGTNESCQGFCLTVEVLCSRFVTVDCELGCRVRQDTRGWPGNLRTSCTQTRHPESPLAPAVEQPQPQVGDAVLASWAQKPMLKVPALWPVASANLKVISEYGKRGRDQHKGIDIQAPMRSHVIATADGIVTFAGGQRGYGNVVKIDHGGGYQTVYGHLDSIVVRLGIPSARHGPGKAWRHRQCLYAPRALRGSPPWQACRPESVPAGPGRGRIELTLRAGSVERFVQDAKHRLQLCRRARQRRPEVNHVPQRPDEQPRSSAAAPAALARAAPPASSRTAHMPIIPSVRENCTHPASPGS